MDVRKIADNLTSGGLSECLAGQTHMYMATVHINLWTSQLSSLSSGEFDYVFWFGDLNYRVEMEREKVDEFLQHHNWMVSHDSRGTYCFEKCNNIFLHTVPSSSRSTHKGDSQR